jgi:outer membrane protein TolC
MWKTPSSHSTAQGTQHPGRNAAAGFERAYDATAASYRHASLFELEDARRSMLAAQMAVTDLHRDRLLAWIALYRAMGGGWSPPDVGRAHHDAARG